MNLHCFEMVGLDPRPAIRQPALCHQGEDDV